MGLLILSHPVLHLQYRCLKKYIIYVLVTRSWSSATMTYHIANRYLRVSALQQNRKKKYQTTTTIIINTILSVYACVYPCFVNVNVFTPWMHTYSLSGTRRISIDWNLFDLIGSGSKFFCELGLRFRCGKIRENLKPDLFGFSPWSRTQKVILEVRVWFQLSFSFK